MLIAYFVGFRCVALHNVLCCQEKKVSKVRNVIDTKALEDAFLKLGLSPKMSWWPPQEHMGLKGRRRVGVVQTFIKRNTFVPR